MNDRVDASSLEPSAKMVAGSTSRAKFQRGKDKAFGRKHNMNATNPLSTQKKKKIQETYLELGHQAKDFHQRRDHGGCVSGGGVGGNPNQANVGNPPNQFWVDIGATRHICNSKSMFSSYQKVNDEEAMYMGNATTVKIDGKGKGKLKLTSGKDLVLTDVLHVAAITKNLIFGPTHSMIAIKDSK
ncbi:hypothetical protein OSB04_005984 [Centaurea solstitialis]|uniref:Retrovirus-related Pol polyprotein from transposon TNT 1-94-like beta-barrel domain-containing protein n=1 Tax=Centaurea solstitialis TaxID=347529 RepID=A0AA38WRR8_9ASTR|nr:hypothetical protein OSB04_005984 [Centaurea solstitialis]